jgi:NAD(P)-dependent dehydrogenase (short-subunit alcohol dehydrogenase family)
VPTTALSAVHWLTARRRRVQAAAEVHHGPVDAVVCCAGVAHPGTFENTPPETFEQHMRCAPLAFSLHLELPGVVRDREWSCLAAGVSKQSRNTQKGVLAPTQSRTSPEPPPEERS